MQQDGSEYWTLPYKELLKRDAIEYKDLRDKLLEFIQLGSKQNQLLSMRQSWRIIFVSIVDMDTLNLRVKDIVPSATLKPTV